MIFSRQYAFLDTAEDRRQFIGRMREARAAVIRMREIVPEERWYQPRYDGWSLAAMLGHLQTMDRVHMLLLQLALRNIRLPLRQRHFERFNRWQLRLFQRRLIATSIAGIHANAEGLERFVLELAVDDFTRRLWYPPAGRALTVEQAVQELLLYHWQEHLGHLQTVEGLRQPPGGRAR